MVNTNLIMYAVVGVALFAAYKRGLLDNFLGSIGGGGGGGGGGSGNGNGGGGGGGNGGGPQPSGELDENGVKLIYATTGNYVDIEVGADHENGQRYNCNHKFQDYMIISYLHTVGSQEAIGCKTDGPNHGSCTSSPECFWIDPDLQLDDCSIIYAAEYPHPDSHPVDCSSCTSCNQDLHDKWVGHASIAYGPPGNRWNEVWVDPGGLVNDTTPANQWQQLLKENYSKNVPSEYANRELPVDFDNGLEAEIRMRSGHGTDMKYGRVYELSSAPTSAYARARRARPVFRKMPSLSKRHGDYLFSNRITVPRF